ncbi:hypothetical protein VPH35_079060 [Triticum aestivum]
MAPTTSWVLLKRRIYTEHDASETRGESSIVAGAAKRGARSRQDITDANLAYLRILKPDARFADPPELSSLRILRPTESIPGLCGQITSAHVASADKNLTIPQPPYDHDRIGVGGGAVVMCLEDGGYYRQGMKVRGPNPTEAVLCTWHSSTANWVVTKAAGFPSELCYPCHLFQVDMCFAFRGSTLCWVDLSKGMVVCDLRAVIQHGAGPEFRFVRLPGGCRTYDRGQRERLPNPEEFRNMACVGGSIKFVTMDGYGERPGSQVTMTVWTLSPDLCSWKKGVVYHVSDIWASESHISLGLLQALPSFPVLSVDEDDVVYLSFTDLDVTVEGRVEFKSQYLLRVDMQHNEVSHHPKSREEMPSQTCSSYYIECLTKKTTTFQASVPQNYHIFRNDRKLPKKL